MKNEKTIRLFSPLLVALISLLPIQVTLCQAAEVAEKSETGNILAPTGKEKVAVGETSEQPSQEKPAEEDESSLSTGMMIGIGAGAAVLLGAAVAAGSSGGGDDAVPLTPPTADQLVSAWHTEGSQPGSGRTYSGTYHLYQGGALGYDLNVSSGEHNVGGGSWRIDGYTLSIHTDHGSLYRGDFAPGNIPLFL